MVKLAGLFFFSFFCSVGLAQNKLTDSLKKLLYKTPNDTDRVLVLTSLGLQFRNTNPDSCIYYSEKALILSRQINFHRGEAFALSTVGIALREKGELPKALELEIQGLQIAESGNYAIEGSYCLRRIGLVYMDLKDYPNSLSYLFRALRKEESVDFKRGITTEYMNLGMTYDYMDQPDSALFYIQKAENGRALIEDLYPEVNRVFGNIYAKKGNQQLALFYYNKGITAAAKLNDYRTISFICSDAARMFRDAKEIDSSISYAEKGVVCGQMASYKKGVLFSSTILSELLDSVNPKRALYFYKIANAAKDSLFGAGNIKTIQTIIAGEQERQKNIRQAEIAYENQLKQYGLLLGLALFLIIGFILYRNNLQKQNANKVLQTTLNNLKSAQSQLIQSEKMASLGELTAGIAHEIQNPLNFVNNFSDVNTELITEMREEISNGNFDAVNALAKDIGDNEEKINHHGKRADAIVKGMLQHSRTSGSTKEPTYINKLADEYLRLTYHGLRAKDKSFNATMKTDFDDSIGSINIIPQDMGRVLLNLITNAFYAVNEKKKQQGGNYEPTVCIKTTKDDDKTEVRISDNGNGIPRQIADKIFQPFFTTKPTGQGTGLGLSLSYDIVKAHGGQIKMHTTEGEGTEFVIEIPR